MARSTLFDLIWHVRGMTAAGTAEYTVADLTYWSNDQVQAILDQHRQDHYTYPLIPVPTYTGGGSISWTVYESGRMFWEQTLDGTTPFVVKDSLGATIGTASYSADYTRGIVTFTADTLGSAFYLTGRTYDLNAAAADLLERWAAVLKLQYSFSSYNKSFERGQQITNLLALAERYRGEQAPVVAYQVRSDLAADEPRVSRHSRKYREGL